MSSSLPSCVERLRPVTEAALRAAVGRLHDPYLRRIAGYQLGWWGADGVDSAEGTSGGSGGGKAIRSTLALLSAEASGQPEAGVSPAVAVELVHNFSLLHDDVMDRDIERRHRPTGWVAFGEGPAILAGNAMLIAAVDELVRAGEPGRRTVPFLLDTTQALISGQAADLALEQRGDVSLDDVLQMEAGKTAALLSCASSIGALAAGAPAEVVAALAAFGHDLGMAFQLIDDILGVTGDPAVTGKSSSSDVRAGKRSAPIVAALSAPSAAADQLQDLLADGPPKSDDDVARATALIIEAGGLAWAAAEADAMLAGALGHLDSVELPDSARADLAAVARYVVGRDR
jgi:geranylgeranyl diphosphate synthase type I